MITIRMPKELLDKWLAALRSGEYRQGSCRLERDGAYCCLGVLQKVVSGDVERSTNGSAYGLPSIDWLTEHSIYFYGQRTPYLPTLDMDADHANDNGRPFTLIADAIEACAEGF